MCFCLLLLCITGLCFLFLLFQVAKFVRPIPIKLKNEHVMITGGSSGIGKCLAKEVYQRGANVTILARNEDRLYQARCETEGSAVSGDQKVVALSVDISGDMDSVEKSIQQAEDILGPVTALINCAGISFASRFTDTRLADFQRLMEVNFFGAVRLTKAVVPGMIAHGGGRIVFVSSMAGQLGLFGYSAYSASKFALRGLAESLQMEVSGGRVDVILAMTFCTHGVCTTHVPPTLSTPSTPNVSQFSVVYATQFHPVYQSLHKYNIHVTLAFPPDTDTPGYADEQKTKPLETRLISEAGGLTNADVVARKMVDDLEFGRFFSSVGLDGFILSTVTSGFSPVTSLIDALLQVFLIGPFRLLALIYQARFRHIVNSCHRGSGRTSCRKNE